MPSASAPTATMLNDGFLTITRTAYRTSARNEPIQAFDEQRDGRVPAILEGWRVDVPVLPRINNNGPPQICAHLHPARRRVRGVDRGLRALVSAVRTRA